MWASKGVHMHNRLFVALILLLILVDGVAQAGVAKRCRRACQGAIQSCVLQTGRPRACRRTYVRACKRSGFTACELTPPTTLPPVTTTTVTVVTSTTTTTTTLPNYAGSWSYYGTLASNECGLDADYSI